MSRIRGTAPVDNNLDGGFSKAYSIDELIDIVNAELTMDCALPQILPINTIKRVIETQAKPWFYQNYRYAVQKMYYFIDRQAFETEEYTRYKWIYLPPEIQTITWLFKVDSRSLYQLGLNAPNLSINLGGNKSTLFIFICYHNWRIGCI